MCNASCSLGVSKRYTSTTEITKRQRQPRAFESGEYPLLIQNFTLVRFVDVCALHVRNGQCSCAALQAEIEPTRTCLFCVQIDAECHALLISRLFTHHSLCTRAGVAAQQLLRVRARSDCKPASACISLPHAAYAGSPWHAWCAYAVSCLPTAPAAWFARSLNACAAFRSMHFVSVQVTCAAPTAAAFSARYFVLCHGASQHCNFAL